MTHVHWIAFGVGVAVGFFVLPMALNLIKAKSA